MKIIEITAFDWAKYEDTYFLPDTFEPILVRVIGYLVEDTPEYISLAMQDYQKDGKQRVRDIMSIPRSCIKAIYEYGKPISGEGYCDKKTEG